MASTALRTIEAAFEQAQDALAEYLQPGPRDAEATVNRLIEILVRQDLADALDELDPGLSLQGKVDESR
jgi:hypothetical protein